MLPRCQFVNALQFFKTLSEVNVLMDFSCNKVKQIIIDSV